MTYREQKIVNPLAEGTILRGAKQEYCIRKALGQGTFGITYRATTKMEGPLGAIEVNVAIKEFFMKSNNNRHGSEVTYSGSDNIFESYKKMFAREASNLGKLNHRHIVKVLEYFEANNTYYYVMEYCSGGSLDNVIARRGQLPEEEALHYFGQLSSAVSHMHAHKMLHLDIKPANIVLRENGELVLIDFGLSKQYDTDGNPESSTRIGAGTPGYAPIEQARHRRDSKQFAATLDVYALGATLFKMLTGVTPPDASEVAEEGLPVDMLRSHGVSEHLVSCLTKAMSLRLKRYQSVSAFAQAVSGATHFDNSRQDDETHIYETDIHYDTPDDEIEAVIVEDPTPTPEPKPRKNLTWLWVTLVGIAGILLTIVGTNSYQAHQAKLAREQFVADSIAARQQFVADSLAAVKKAEEERKAAIEKHRQDSIAFYQATHGRINGHEYVDLGLSVKWATCNVGASTPEEYGDYFAWGETETKSKYTAENSVTYKKRFGDISGDSRYDAARRNWGGCWRMPTKAECQELVDNCTCTWTTQGGHKGYKVTSKKNGNSIFLPAAGYRDGSSLYRQGEWGGCWSSTPHESDTGNAYHPGFHSGGHDMGVVWGDRNYGFTVRPVCD